MNLQKINLIIACVLIGSFFIFSTSKNIISYPKHIDYPLEMDFCGEKVPMHIVDVKERVDREMSININMNSTTSLLIKRAHRAFGVIEPILAKNNVPDDFKYLAVIESGLVNAVSPAGARGVWQFMTQTARQNNLEITDEVDERYHLEKSTEAACKYLLDAKERLGSWTMAAAAYNGGVVGLKRQIDNQLSSSYYDLYLTEETYRYVFRILSLKEIMKNPEKYGYSIPEHALYKKIATKTITIDSTITSLSNFAKNQGINFKLLKVYNPWLKDKKLTNPDKKTYSIEIPTEGI